MNNQLLKLAKKLGELAAEARDSTYSDPVVNQACITESIIYSEIAAAIMQIMAEGT